MEINRGTGKSFRAVLRALVAASIGTGNVVVVSGHARQNKSNFELALKISNGYATSEKVNVITFPNNCTVTFMTNGQRPRLVGRKVSEVIHDRL